VLEAAGLKCPGDRTHGFRADLAPRMLEAIEDPRRPRAGGGFYRSAAGGRPSALNASSSSMGKGTTANVAFFSSLSSVMVWR
jgi:hypothetical protein